MIREDICKENILKKINIFFMIYAKIIISNVRYHKCFLKLVSRYLKIACTSICVCFLHINFPLPVVFLVDVSFQLQKSISLRGPKTNFPVVH